MLSFVLRFSDLEEAFSLMHTYPQGQRGFRSLQDFFTRATNVEVIRPTLPEAVVVAPADSVVQNAFFIRPNNQGEIRDAHIPQVLSTLRRLDRLLRWFSWRYNALPLSRRQAR